jgi:diguanylate cyclase (GGDEF)-like protein
VGRFPPLDDKGHACLFATGRDLRARMLAEERIRRLAYYDTLTGLPNRQLFADRLQQALLRARRGPHSLAVMFLDLDQFKQVNDTQGHHTGDRLLREAADRMAGLIRRQDSIARMGGDEFTILLEQVAGPADAALVARKVLHTLGEPFQLDHRALNLGASIGISLFPQDGADCDTLLKNADIAMYRAKQNGRHNYQFYAGEMDEETLKRLGLDRRLRDAVAAGQLVVYYQPQYDLQTLRISGVEALVRWHDPVEGLLAPDHFLPLAEENGVILPLDEWVLNCACSQAKAWDGLGLAFRRLAVNISSRQLQSQDIVDKVADALRRSSLPPSALELDIDEAGLLRDPGRTGAVLRDLEALGVTLSLDNFGSGSLPLSFLKRLPIRKLKIDRTLVQHLADDRNTAALVRAILALGASLQLEVAAEGVESEEQRRFLEQEGCREAQGYLFARPLPAAHVTPLLHPPRPSPITEGSRQPH